jgi:hypothetical protein
LERNQVPLSAEITCRFRPKSGAGLLRFLHPYARRWGRGGTARCPPIAINVLYARGRPRPSACFCATPPPLGGRQALNKAINGSRCWSTASTGPTGVAPSASDCSRPKCGSSKAMPLSGRCRRAGSSDSDAREPLFRSEAIQAAARRPHQKVLGWRLAGAAPAHAQASVSRKLRKPGLPGDPSGSALPPVGPDEFKVFRDRAPRLAPPGPAHKAIVTRQVGAGPASSGKRGGSGRAAPRARPERSEGRRPRLIRTMTINFRMYPQWAAYAMASARLDGIRRRCGARDRRRDAARGCKRGDRAGHQHGGRHAAGAAGMAGAIEGAAEGAARSRKSRQTNTV